MWKYLACFHQVTDSELLWLLKVAELPRLLTNLLKARVDPELRQPAVLQRVLWPTVVLARPPPPKSSRPHPQEYCRRHV